jgi:hypothetical protein
MSRTIRRKNTKGDLKWIMWDCAVQNGRAIGFQYEPDSVEYARRLARYHADGYENFKEPGPAWYRNMFTERPQRREARRQLRAYIKGEADDVVLNAMDRLTYWT